MQQKNVILCPESESKTTPKKSFKDVVAKHVEPSMSSSPPLVSSQTIQEAVSIPNKSSNGGTSPVQLTAPGVASWQWHDVYRWILQLNDGQFVKYNKSLYDGLCTQNITGSKLSDLTPTDWLVLGVTESFDIQTITTQIGRLRLPSSSSPSLSDHDMMADTEGVSCSKSTHNNHINSNNNRNINTNNNNNSNSNMNMNMNSSMVNAPSYIPTSSSHSHSVPNHINAIQCTQTQTNNMWIINGNVMGTALHQTQQNFNLYLHQTQQQLNCEHNKRVLAESALAELHSKSGQNQKLLQEALSRCIQQYNAMAQLSGSLQCEARNKDQELEAMKGEHDRLMAEYEKKVELLEREMTTRTEAEEQCRTMKTRYHEMHGAMQQRHRELESKYNDLESRYNAMEEKWDHLRRFRRWDFNEVYLWIIGIDDGYFGRKYVDLYDHLEIQQIGGNALADFGVDAIGRLGIVDVIDQRRLLANIRVLLQNGSEGTAVTDRHHHGLEVDSNSNSMHYDLDIDYSNIDLLTESTEESIL